MQTHSCNRARGELAKGSGSYKGHANLGLLADQGQLGDGGRVGAVLTLCPPTIPQNEQDMTLFPGQR